ncbi:hypothetical protein C8Q76DRAFT_72864 [Earliella scabrosa]|nr:hypothetical protein C8Q76DRAFT_72864 [Earliella scabrosa]
MRRLVMHLTNHCGQDSQQLRDDGSSAGDQHHLTAYMRHEECLAVRACSDQYTRNRTLPSRRWPRLQARHAGIRYTGCTTSYRELFVQDPTFVVHLVSCPLQVVTSGTARMQCLLTTARDLYCHTPNMTVHQNSGASLQVRSVSDRLILAARTPCW